MDQAPSEQSEESKGVFSAIPLKNQYAIVWIILSIVVMLALSGFYLFLPGTNISMKQPLKLLCWQNRWNL